MSNEVPRDDMCEIVERPYKGKPFAYIPTMDTGWQGWCLSIVVDGEGGHYQQQPRFAYGTEAEMQDVSRQLNRERLHLSTDDVARLVVSSMFLSNTPSRRQRTT